MRNVTPEQIAEEFETKLQKDFEPARVTDDRQKLAELQKSITAWLRQKPR